VTNSIVLLGFQTPCRLDVAVVHEELQIVPWHLLSHCVRVHHPLQMITMRGRALRKREGDDEKDEEGGGGSGREGRDSRKKGRKEKELLGSLAIAQAGATTT
jgi:hypothetical protein